LPLTVAMSFALAADGGVALEHTRQAAGIERPAMPERNDQLEDTGTGWDVCAACA
jgi:hypothetical protein